MLKNVKPYPEDSFPYTSPLKEKKKKKKRETKFQGRILIYGSACVICVEVSQELPISIKV